MSDAPTMPSGDEPTYDPQGFERLLSMAGAGKGIVRDASTAHEFDPDELMDYLANLTAGIRRIADALEVIAHESALRQQAAAHETERQQEREAEAYCDRAQWIAETEARLADDHYYVSEDEQSDLEIARAQQRHIEATRPEVVKQAAAIEEQRQFADGEGI